MENFLPAPSPQHRRPKKIAGMFILVKGAQLARHARRYFERSWKSEVAESSGNNKINAIGKITHSWSFIGGLLIYQFYWEWRQFSRYVFVKTVIELTISLLEVTEWNIKSNVQWNKICIQHSVRIVMNALYPTHKVSEVVCTVWKTTWCWVAEVPAVVTGVTNTTHATPGNVRKISGTFQRSKAKSTLTNLTLVPAPRTE